ncbi:uncharacterized protein DS421_17g595380 [Arachis hypogaea]|nr:uncharacterized protein LOC114925683 [Arachis hypogaea]QHN93755.1 uncharacterized protein DS421_17g595380 [Arachis hypogaea]
MNKKILFIVDPRPVGYELNTSLHVVRAVCDDVEIVKFLEDSSDDNEQQFSFTPMQAFSVHRAQVLQWVRLHPFLFSTGVVGMLTMIFMQESHPHKVRIYLGVISLSLLRKSFGVLLDNVKILSKLLKGWMSVVANHLLH